MGLWFNILVNSHGYLKMVSLTGELKIAVRGDGKSPDLKVNDKQLQTANLVFIFDEIILSVTASKYGMMTTIELTSFLL